MRSLILPYLGFRSQILTIISLVLLPTSYATCYWPNGDIDDSYVQCPNTLSCCLKGESCLSNGLCFTANFGILYRGACADKSWPIAECPRACYTEIDDGWANLFQCNTSTDLLTCNHDYTSAGIVCNGYGVGTYSGYTSANVTAAEVGVSSYEETTNTTSTNSTSSQHHSSISTIYSTITVTSCPSSLSTNNSKLLALGAGLGAGIGAPLLLATSLLIYYNILSRKLGKQLQQQSSAWSQTPHQTSAQYPAYLAELGSPATVYNELEGESKGRKELTGS